VLVSDLPGKIRLLVRGPATVVGRLKSDDVGPLSVRLGEAVAEGRVAIHRGMLRLPEGVRLVSASPDRIDFVFERHAEKRVPVAVDVGRIDRDLRVAADGISVYPSDVRVSGPVSLVDRFDEIPTATVDLSGRRAGLVEREAALSFVSAPLLVVDPQSVRVDVRLEPDRIESVRTGVPVDVVRGTDLDPAGALVFGAGSLRVEVRVRGLRTAIEALAGSEIRLFARVDRSAFDPAGAAPATARIPIEAERRSEGWEVVDVTPAAVEVTYVPPPPPPPVIDETPGDGAAGEAATAPPVASPARGR
jgi:hypothetical protein